MILTMLRKSLDGTVADNTLKHGCGSINIDATRIGDLVQDTSKNGRSPDKHKKTVFQSGLKEEFEGKITTGRWPANFILIEGDTVKELDQQSGHLKSGKPTGTKKAGTGYHGNFPGGEMTGGGDEGGASRFFKQFKKGKQMKEMIEYFKTMITPPVDDACVIVSSPDEIDFSSYKKEVYEEGGLIPSYEPIVHGLILLGEPTAEQSKEILDILKPGAHVVMIPKDIGYKGVIALEDTGFEVRDAIFVAEEPNTFSYTSKASRSEREAGLSAEGDGRANIHPTVKPIEIMEWCARDVEANSKVVDPFLGSGTTGIAMSRLGHDFVGIELNPDYAKICEARIRHWMPIGTEIESEAQVGKVEPKEGDQISILDIFDWGK